MKLLLTGAALEDLRSVRAYTLERWGEEQEECYLRNLWSRIQSLRADPLIHRLSEDLFPSCRIATEGRHVILFRANKEALEIVRVLHSAMDFRQHLAPEVP